MVEPGSKAVSVRRQCELLQVARSGLYYEPVAPRAEDLRLMRVIDGIYIDRPYYGSRRMTVKLRRIGFDVNRKKVQRLMRVMGLEGVVPGPHTSKPHPEHPVYPWATVLSPSHGTLQKVWPQPFTADRDRPGAFEGVTQNPSLSLGTTFWGIGGATGLR